MVALGGVACALGGAALAASGLAGPPSTHLTVSLLMIGEQIFNSFSAAAYFLIFTKAPTPQILS